MTDDGGERKAGRGRDEAGTDAGAAEPAEDAATTPEEVSAAEDDPPGGGEAGGAKGPSPARIDYDEATLALYVEALLFVSQRPLTVAQIARPLRTTFAAVRKAFRTIGEACAGRGIRLVDVGGGYQFRTAPECADVLRRFLDVKPLRLSKAAMETLAVVAYRQPVTKPDVDEIRGVDSGSAVKLLLDRNLVRILGRKEEPGRPLLYGTTHAFLEFFGLASLSDLPSLREYAELSEDGRRQLERDLFARAPEPATGAEEAGPRVHARHWEDLVEVLGEDLGGLPDGVEVEPAPTGDPLQDYLLSTRVPGVSREEAGDRGSDEGLAGEGGVPTEPEPAAPEEDDGPLDPDDRDDEDRA